MDADMENEIRWWIRDWRARMNSGTGNRRKSSQTAKADALYLTKQIADGTFATTAVVDFVRLAGFPSVTADHVITVASAMLERMQVPA